MTGGGADETAFANAERMLRDGPLLRVVNFHHTPEARADDLDRLLMRLARRFQPVDEARLDSYCETGEWRGRPGIIPAFYNGYRSNFDVARPLLDRYGLVGWFFVVSGFVSEPAETQGTFAASHGFSAGPENASPDKRRAMSWDEVRRLDGPHVVASHTRRHGTIETNEPEAVLRDGIVGAQDDFRAALGHPVMALAANKGGPYGRNPVADRLIGEAGYRFVFSNLKVQRVDAARPDLASPAGG